MGREETHLCKIQPMMTWQRRSREIAPRTAASPVTNVMLATCWYNVELRAHKDDADESLIDSGRDEWNIS